MQRPPRTRNDVEFLEIDDETYEVRDPVRSTKFLFGPLQRSIYGRLDGTRELAEVCEEVREEFEVEIPLSEVSEFTSFLREHFLLEVTEYDLSAPALRRRIRRRLVRSGAIRRAWAHATELEGASPGLLSCLLASFETNATDSDLLELLRSSVAPSELRAIARKEFLAFQDNESWQWTIGNPDAASTRIDNAIGSVVYSPVGALALLGLCCLAVLGAAGSQLPTPDQFTWLDGLFGYGLKYVFTLFGHEILGHGLAAKHYGGTVPEVGATLRNRSSLVLYCDVSDALGTGQTRGAKVVIFLGGVLIDIAIASTIIAFFTLVCTLGDAPAPVLVAAGFIVLSAIENAMPIRGHDGCWAVAALLNLERLWLGENAHRYWAMRLGLAPDTMKASPREERIYFVFGLVELAAVFGFFVGIWLYLVVPLLISYFGGVAGAALSAPTTLGFVRGRLLPLARGLAQLARQRR